MALTVRPARSSPRSLSFRVPSRLTGHHSSFRGKEPAPREPIGRRPRSRRGLGDDGRRTRDRTATTTRVEPFRFRSRPRRAFARRVRASRGARASRGGRSARIKPRGLARTARRSVRVGRFGRSLAVALARWGYVALFLLRFFSVSASTRHPFVSFRADEIDDALARMVDTHERENARLTRGVWVVSRWNADEHHRQGMYKQSGATCRCAILWVWKNGWI